jgi:short-subunit dehydrogenase
VNICSVLGHRAVPLKSEYCASKFALHGFSDSLRAELVADGIDVILVSPSTTESEFFDRVIDDRSAQKRRSGMSPARVASATMRAIEKRRHEVIVPFEGKALVLIDRFWPSLADRIVARFG